MVLDLISWLFTLVSGVIVYKSYNYVRRISATFDRESLLKLHEHIARSLSCADEALYSMNPDPDNEEKKAKNYVSKRMEALLNALSRAKMVIPSKYAEKIEMTDGIYDSLWRRLDAIVSGRKITLMEKSGVVSEIKRSLEKSLTDVDKLVKEITKKIGD